MQARQLCLTLEPCAAVAVGSKDSGELFYLSPRSEIVGVDVDAGVIPK